MTSLLLTISFLLHFITLFAVYLLFKELQNRKKSQAADLDDLLAVYLEAFKEENERLEKKLTQPSVPVPKKVKQSSPMQQQVERTVSKKETVKEKPKQLPADKQEHENDSLETFDIPEVQDNVEASVHAQILHLAQQGKTPTEIAKQLGCGETEAALVLKLYRNKD